MISVKIRIIVFFIIAILLAIACIIALCVNEFKNAVKFFIVSLVFFGVGFYLKKIYKL